MKHARITTAAAAFAACGLALAAPVQAGSAKSKSSIKMFDNYYDPAKVTLKPDGSITWKWPVDVGDSHDVKLKSGPKGARFSYTNDDGKKVSNKKSFQSPPFASGPAKWTVKGFTKPGKYKLYCTFHETEMTMTVVVPKKG
jgi:plastocyanin